RRTVEGTNVHPATARAVALSTKSTRSGAPTQPAPYPASRSSAATAAKQSSLTCHSVCCPSSAASGVVWGSSLPQHASLIARIHRRCGPAIGSVVGAQRDRVPGRSQQDLGRGQQVQQFGAGQGVEHLPPL